MSGVIPLTILTGFLGAGKTTLLNRILTSDHGLRVAVLVNDFGSINVDAELIVGVEDNVISLANGCTCCTLRDDLVATVLDTINRPERPEYIVLEASGVADPAGIVMAFNTPNLAEQIRLDSVTCVVDADDVFAYPEHPRVNQLKLLQIAFADMVILNKVSLAGPVKVAAAREWINEHFDNIRVFETDFADVPNELLLGVGRFDVEHSDAGRIDAEGSSPGATRAVTLPEELAVTLSEDAAVTLPEELAVTLSEETTSAPAHVHHDAAAFDTWTYVTEASLSLVRLEDAVANLPGTVFRCKGIVRAAEHPDRPAVLQVVSRRVDVSLLDQWRQQPSTRIVVIAAPGGIDETALQDILDSCVADGA